MQTTVDKGAPLMSWVRALRSQANLRRGRKIQAFVVDVDGVLTDGSFLYDSSGKKYKRFGPDDADALKILGGYIEIEVVSADSRGFEISRARVADMGLQLSLVSSGDRLAWVAERYEFSSVAYMGDSFQDAELLRTVGLGLCPGNGHFRAKEAAAIVTRCDGGSRAVAEACGIIARRNQLPIGRLL